MSRRCSAALIWPALIVVAVTRVLTQEPKVSKVVPDVRFHHLHYRVADPAAAMNEAARTLGGVRVIVPGLGVGVRAGAEYLLFDRLDDSDPVHLSQPAVVDAYASAVAWLAARGVTSAGNDTRAPRVFTALPDGRYHHIAFVASELEGVVQTLAVAGASPVRRADDAVMFEGGTVLLEVVRDLDRAETFWCPMHLDVRSPDEGKCPVCGMSLVPIPPPKIGEYNLDVTQLRDEKGHGLSGLRLMVREPDTGAAATRFSTVHEKPFHLFIVSRDLEYFAHVHPEPRDGGAFALRHPIPPGEYMLIADFLPAGGTPQMVQKAIIVSGRRSPPTSEQAGGLHIGMDIRNLSAGKQASLTFTVADARTGAPITDLEPYLGAPAHLLIVRRDLTDAIHSHPEEVSTVGPTVSFHPLLPSAGDYKLWIQVQRAGEVITKAFVLTVRP
jgi:hypothetical protein